MLFSGMSSSSFIVYHSPKLPLVKKPQREAEQQAREQAASPEVEEISGTIGGLEGLGVKVVFEEHKNETEEYR
jgi:hypothetical protein